MSDKLMGLLDGRIPNRCPFCWEVDGVVWREFEVFATETFYFDVEKNEFHKTGRVAVNVTCTRCGEEIRAEDVEK